MEEQDRLAIEESENCPNRWTNRWKKEPQLKDLYDGLGMQRLSKQKQLIDEELKIMMELINDMEVWRSIIIQLWSMNTTTYK